MGGSTPGGAAHPAPELDNCRAGSAGRTTAMGLALKSFLAASLDGADERAALKALLKVLAETHLHYRELRRAPSRPTTRVIDALQGEGPGRGRARNVHLYCASPTAASLPRSQEHPAPRCTTTPAHLQAPAAEQPALRGGEPPQRGPRRPAGPRRPPHPVRGPAFLLPPGRPLPRGRRLVRTHNGAH